MAIIFSATFAIGWIQWILKPKITAKNLNHSADRSRYPIDSRANFAAANYPLLLVIAYFWK
jgi:hypothetical protein